MKVCVVTVTYGNRFKFLKQVVDACLKEGVNKIIVVDNASHPESREKLKKLESILRDKIKVIYLDKNTGSAEGYKRGLEEAYNCKDCEFIWLLDDDNMPEKGTLEKYFYYLKKFSRKEKTPVLLGFRDSRPQYIEAYKLCCGNILLEPKDSFIGFHIFYYWKKLFLKRFKLKLSKDNNSCDYIKVPTASFGGLFFKKEVLNEVGFPNEKYYLYEDDTDFSYRMTLKGFNIYLIPKIKIKDLDEYWCEKKGKEPHPYFTRDENRFYYFIRNKLFFQKKYRVENDVIFNINKFIYNIRMLILSLINKNISRFHLYRKAVSDAIRNRMGKRKRRLLFISHVLDGSGAPRSLLNLIKYMPKNEIEIDLLALRRNDLKEEFEKALNKKIFVITEKPPNNKILKIIERIRSISKITFYILKINPDLVFINSAANSRAITIAKLLGYKTLVFVHEFNEEFAFLPKIRRKFINFADKVFCLSNIHKNWLREEVGYKKDIVILPNGINLDDVKTLSLEEPEKKFKEFTRRFDFIIANVGYLTIRKGWDYYLEIIKKLKNEKDIGFVIVGDFLEQKEKIKFLNELQDLGLIDRVYITGITKNIFKYLKYCHLTAITSRSEVFPRVALESMAIGIPFIFFDVGAIKIVPPDNYPYKVKPFDIDTYVEFIKEIRNLDKVGKEKLSWLLKERANIFDTKRIAYKFYYNILNE